MTVLALFVAVVTTASSSSTSYALNTETHRLINEAAANQSGLDTFLKTQLGLLSGVNEVFKGLKVFEWIAEGGVREDDGLRFFRHFHDPLQPSASAGLLDPLCLGRCDSSIRWMQRGYNNWSWHQARRSYWTALTAPEPTQREQAFVDTFRALGQTMHLVVDASVPEHVRNDAHPLGLVFGNYEYWISSLHGRFGSVEELAFVEGYLSSPLSFDPSILREPTGDPEAPLPVARLIDTDRYTGLLSGPNVTLGSAIGIAEFANANFFSEDTGNRSYPFPNFDTLVPSQHLAPKTGTVRAYFAKGPGDGLPVDPVLAECVLYEPAVAEGISDPIVRTCTDENVWERVAEAMLPRAVGYARGVIDYFFRGRLEVVHASDQISTPGEVHVRVRNVTPGEESGPGGVIGVMEVKAGDQKSFRVSEPHAITLTSDFQDVVSCLWGRTNPTRRSRFLSVVYYGPLGLEEDAVMIGGRVPLKLASVCDASQRPQFCIKSWIVLSPGAMLMIEASGEMNTVDLIADATNIDGGCTPFPECRLTSTLSFDSVDTFSITAPVTQSADKSFFALETHVQRGGYLCLYSVSSNASKVLAGPTAIGNWRFAFCPQ